MSETWTREHYKAAHQVKEAVEGIKWGDPMDTLCAEIAKHAHLFVDPEDFETLTGACIARDQAESAARSARAEADALRAERDVWKINAQPNAMWFDAAEFNADVANRIARAVQAEREACAGIAEFHGNLSSRLNDASFAGGIASAIRARTTEHAAKAGQAVSDPAEAVAGGAAGSTARSGAPVSNPSPGTQAVPIVCWRCGGEIGWDTPFVGSPYHASHVSSQECKPRAPSGAQASEPVYSGFDPAKHVANERPICAKCKKPWRPFGEGEPLGWMRDCACDSSSASEPTLPHYEGVPLPGVHKLAIDLGGPDMAMTGADGVRHPWMTEERVRMLATEEIDAAEEDYEARWKAHADRLTALERAAQKQNTDGGVPRDDESALGGTQPRGLPGWPLDQAAREPSPSVPPLPSREEIASQLWQARGGRGGEDGYSTMADAVLALLAERDEAWGKRVAEATSKQTEVDAGTLHKMAVECDRVAKERDAIRGQSAEVERHWDRLMVLREERLRASQERVAELERDKKGAYEERDRLVCALSKCFPAWLARHSESDTTWDADWRWIVFVRLPTGQASWHIHDSECGWFGHLRIRENDWDGHTTEEKYRRLTALTLKPVDAKPALAIEAAAKECADHLCPDFEGDKGFAGVVTHILRKHFRPAPAPPEDGFVRGGIASSGQSSSPLTISDADLAHEFQVAYYKAYNALAGYSRPHDSTMLALARRAKALLGGKPEVRLPTRPAKARDADWNAGFNAACDVMGSELRAQGFTLAGDAKPEPAR